MAADSARHAAYDDVVDAYHARVGVSLTDPTLQALLDNLRGQRVCGPQPPSR